MKDRIDEDVARVYTRAVTRTTRGAACCGGGPVPRGAVARLAGDGSGELAASIWTVMLALLFVLI